ncbi:TIM barrel protein [Gemmobacter sp. 24YEA27]|uniref:hydroxypyruvate isomerase family protein n=1 Tax=Gemmobacter sp. 24YEA27 TaxID=3040672 RepID=UPI0024B3B1B4|nr:TIM barrel protein [Gemmobacter sp. 24YEA27]
MSRFAANLTYLFTEVPMLDRPDWARRTGFDGVEVLFPYDHPVAEWERALGDIPLVLINTPPGDWASGDRGFAARPGDEQTFRDGFLHAADYATRLNVPAVHVMAGVARGPQAEAVFTANLSWAAEQAPDLTLVMEPLNPDDMPGYFLNDFDQAARIIDDIANPRIGLQFDIWHAAKLHGDAASVWADHRDRIRHVQIAGFPARNEPGGGGFSLPDLCDAVAELENVWISAEYRPARGTAQGLFWLNALKSRGALIGG